MARAPEHRAVPSYLSAPVPESDAEQTVGCGQIYTRLSFLNGGQAMGQKVRVSKRKPKPLWTQQRLAELEAELDRLKQQVRVADNAKSRTSRSPRLHG